MNDYIISYLNVYVLLGCWLLQGLIFIRITAVKMRLLPQVLAIGLCVQTSIYLLLSYIGVPPNNSYLYCLLTICLVNILLLLDKKHRQQVQLLVSEIKNWAILGLALPLLLLLIIHFLGYEPPFVFYNKDDTISYLSMSDFFWDNLPFEVEKVFDTNQGTLKHSTMVEYFWANFSSKSESGIINYNLALPKSFLFNEISLFRPGNWTALVPSYAIFGAQPHSFLFGLFCALWILVGTIVQASFEEFSKIKVKNSLIPLFLLSPFFVYMTFDGYLGQTLFVPYFVLLLSYSKRSFSENKKLRMSAIIPCGMTLAATMLFFPEFMVLVVVILLGQLVQHIIEFDSKRIMRQAKPYFLFWILSVIVSLCIGNVGFIKSVSDIIVRAGSTDYMSLHQAFSGPWYTYSLNVFGAVFYPEQLNYKYLNICAFFTAVIILSNLRQVSDILTKLRFEVLFSILFMGLISSYATVKTMALWSALLTPYLLLSIKGKRRLLLGSVVTLTIFMLLQTTNRREWGHIYIYDYFQDMRKVKVIIEKEYPEEALLFVIRQHRITGDLALLLSRHKGEITTSNAIFGNGIVPNSKYGQDMLNSCEKVSERLIVTADFMLDPSNTEYKWLQDCSKTHKCTKVGRMSIIDLSVAR